MAVTYDRILKQIALTTNSLGDATTPALLNTAYDTSPLTAANFTSQTGSAMFAFRFLIDAMLNSQEGLFYALASTSTNPLRGFIESQTANRAYGDQILTNAAGTPVVGAYGAVRDAITFEPCTLNELEDIRDRHLNPGSMFKLAVYQYAILDKRIYHTRTNVIVDVCAYVRPDADTLDLTTGILVPDVLGPAMVQGAIAECYRDDEYMAQAAQAAEFYKAWIQALQSGMAQIQPQSNPTPDAQTRYIAA